MRKIVMLNRVSVDGFFAGVHGEMDWFIHDPAVDEAAHEMMKPDTLLMGRITYEMFHGYWPGVAADPDAPAQARTIAGELNRMTKVVFSRTLRDVTWANSTLVKADIGKAVRELKRGEGPDITIFGSGSIVRQLANEGLIDEYLMTVTPVVLGKGKALFEGVERLDLELLGSRDFAHGNVLHHYRARRRTP